MDGLFQSTSTNLINCNMASIIIWSVKMKGTNQFCLNAIFYQSLDKGTLSDRPTRKYLPLVHHQNKEYWQVPPMDKDQLCLALNIKIAKS